MAENNQSFENRPPRRHRGPGGPLGAPADKAKDFKRTLKN